MARNQAVKPRRYNYSALIEQVLAPYSVWSPAKDRWRSACPFHGGDNVTSFSVFVTGQFVCFKCGAAGGMADLLVKTRRLTLKQALDYLKTAPSPRMLMPGDDELLPRRRLVKPRLPYGVMREAEIVVFKRQCPTYLVQRGFSQASLLRYEIGYDQNNAKIVIPVRDVESRLVGLTYRVDFDGDRTQAAKYWHDQWAKALHLYGLHLHRRQPMNRFYLVEGQLDVVRMSQLGLPSAAIMGSEISDAQVTLLKREVNANQIVLMFDNDEAGYKARAGAIRKLTKTRFARSLSVARYGGKDPGDLESPRGIRVEPWASCLLGN